MRNPFVALPVLLLAVALLIGSALVPGAEPVLSNYIPAVDHPLFAAGLVVFAFGVLLALLDGRLAHAGGRPLLHLPESSAIFLRAAMSRGSTPTVGPAVFTSIG